MAVVRRRYLHVEISVMSRRDGHGLTQSHREEQVHGQKGEKLRACDAERERERENYCFTFLMNKHYKRIDIVALL